MNKSTNRIILILGLVLLAVAAYLIMTRSAESSDKLGLTIVLVLLTMVLILLGNYLVTTFLDRFVPWKKYRLIRFGLQVFFGLTISLVVVNGVYMGLKDLFTEAAPDKGQMIVINIYGAAIVIPIIALYFGVKFLKAWNISQLEAERLQKENARSQMMSLRNHLDPHFLFNNLNILSSLMDHDIDLSKKYLDKFAEVYRTILRSELSDLITLEEELKLIDAYIYLIKIRWHDALHISINIRPEDNKKALPPLSAQMLIENIIKNNTISKSSSMDIVITSANDFLMISNTKKPKLYADNKKSGTGLINIQNRYAYFTDRKVQIDNHPDIFEIRLPLLTIE